MGWWRGAVIYQIYPRSFLDVTGDGIGDLDGIGARLDYLASLGVDAIWLSPVFPSPMKDFGYDVADFTGIDPLFGSFGGFDALVRGAHDRGLKVVLDQVWSHTSDAHPWFAESAASPRGLRADWYVWADARPDGSPPNNWLSVFGGPAWSWSPVRRQYYLHNFLASQPDLNFHNPAVQDAVLDAARFWLDRGVDGFRLDVVNYYAHDPALTDNPASGRPGSASPYRMQRHLHDCDQPQTLAFVARLRALLDQYGALGLGEIFTDEPLARQLEYTDGPDRLHTAYSFFLLDAEAASPDLFRQAIQAWDGAAGWPAWSLSNHDVVRFPTRLGAAEPGRIKALIALLCCLRGTPILYQGDELGLPHGRVPLADLQDPFAIASFTGGSGRDGARTPMPWSAAAPNAGFSSAARPWLPLDPAHRDLAVDRQEGDPLSILNFVRGFLRLRKALPALQAGAIRLLPAPEGVLAFERAQEGARVLCVFELAGRPAQIQASGLNLAASGLAASQDGGMVSLRPYGAALLTD